MSQPAELSYARPDADHIPRVIEHLEQAFDASGMFEDPGTYFVSTADAAVYFTRSLARRYSIDSADRRCVNCGRPEADCVALIDIKATARSRFWAMRSHRSRDVQVVMPLCRSCYRPAISVTPILQHLQSLWWAALMLTVFIVLPISQAVFKSGLMSCAVVAAIMLPFWINRLYINSRTLPRIRASSNDQLTYTMHRWKLYSRSRSRSFLLQSMRSVGPVEANAQVVVEATLAEVER